MIEAEFGAKAAQAHALLAELAAAISSDTSGVLAVEILPELLGSVRQGELAVVRAIERADRSGAYANDGAASTVAFVRQVSGESNAWASKRVQFGRALADRMPATAKAFETGDLGLDHAHVIQQATKELQQDLAADGDLPATLMDFVMVVQAKQIQILGFGLTVVA